MALPGAATRVFRRRRGSAGAGAFSHCRRGGRHMPPHPAIDSHHDSHDHNSRQHQHHVQELDHRNLAYSISDFRFWIFDFRSTAVKTNHRVHRGARRIDARPRSVQLCVLGGLSLRPRQSKIENQNWFCSQRRFNAWFMALKPCDSCGESLFHTKPTSTPRNCSDWIRRVCD